MLKSKKIKDNPSLTLCGSERAQQLATMLEQAKIKTIYSTSYARTLATAKPLAEKKQLSIKNYSPRGLKQLALKLKQNKENTLVVGHSNTTPQLASLLINEDVASITEKEYQMLYQIQFTGTDKNLTIIKQPLRCD